MAHKGFFEDVHYLWKLWSIQGFMILSLAMQLFLALAAPLRKKTSHTAVIVIMWMAYFLSDWAAIFAFGLIANARCNKSSSDLDGTKNLLALWASFLLIHLGGPDSITAYALEDNALWVRYLVRLVAQVIACFYIFSKMLPQDMLVVPTILVFTTGIIKYGERIRALYLASLKNFKDTSIKPQDSVRLDGDLANSGIQEVGLEFFHIFKGLIVDIMPNHSQWEKSRKFFDNKDMDAESAFKIISIELNLLYDVFYTKIIAVYSSWGVYIRNVASFMSITALIIFCKIKKDGLKHTDVCVTYALLSGVIVLDSTTEVMMVTSNWRTRKWRIFKQQIFGRCVIPFLMTALVYAIVIHLLYICGCKSIVDRSWSSEMHSFNLLTYSFEEGRTRKRCTLSGCCHRIFGYIHEKTGIELRKIKEEIDKIRYTKKISMDNDIWKYTFDILHRRAFSADIADQLKKIHEARGDRALQDTSDELKKIYEARGDLALQDTSDELKKIYEARGDLALQDTSEELKKIDELKRYVTEFEYDHSVLLWHVATEICYNTDTNLKKNDENVKFGKILSDYMIYLMVKKPDMMSAVADIFPKRFQDTYGELKGLEQKVHDAETLNEFCSKVLHRNGDGIEPDHQGGNPGASVLTDSLSLVAILERNGMKWKIICKVWVELLLYAAGHCRANSHARLVSEGGEFVTFVWLLMAHFGIGPRFPKH